MYFTTMNFRITPYDYDIPTHKQETAAVNLFILLKVCILNEGFKIFTFDYDKVLYFMHNNNPICYFEPTVVSKQHANQQYHTTPDEEKH